jgi:transposase InsO family protein
LPRITSRSVNLPLSLPPDRAAPLTKRIREVAATRVRYGYRRVHALLKREGWNVNAKRVYRIYRELGLQLRNKTPRWRVKAVLRDDRRPAAQASETWATMDFVHDQLATGCELRVLTTVDTFTRFSPAIEARFNFRGADVVEVLEQIGRAYGYQKRSASIRERSLSRVILIFGPITVVLRSTSRDRANPPTCLH